MRPKRANADARVADIAARQHGVATLTQLTRAGLSPAAVKRRLQSGRFHRIHRGVYAVGHPGLSNHGRWKAAVLACGEGTVLSHRSAAELWELLAPTTGTIHITVPTPGGRQQRRGLRIHRCSLPKQATTSHQGIAATTPARTLVDLRHAISPQQLRRARRQAEFRGLPLEDTPTDRTRSDLEREFLRLCRRHGIPMPEVNASVGRFTVDFLWRRERLVVETDGYAAHRGRQAFEDDRERELELHAAGHRVCRFSDRQLRRRPGVVAAAVLAALRD